MPRLASAIVDIEPNLRPLHAGLAQARTAISSFAQSSGGRIPLTIAMGATGLSVGGLVAGLGDAALKAAKLQEALSKVKVTFGEEAGGVLANVDELSKKFGVSKREAADAAAEFGLLAKAAGMSAYEQARFSKEFNQIAIDLASFHVTTRPEAVQKLMSGLEGMVRPLRQFGIFIDEAKVKAEATALGLRKHNEELTDEQKILVRSILIRKQAGVALGDAERSMARPYEQIKKFWGELESAQSAFGKNLQGSLLQAIALARELGEQFTKTFGSGKELGEEIEAVIRAARQLNKPITLEPRAALGTLRDETNALLLKTLPLTEVKQWMVRQDKAVVSSLEGFFKWIRDLHKIPEEQHNPVDKAVYKFFNSMVNAMESASQYLEKEGATAGGTTTPAVKGMLERVADRQKAFTSAMMGPSPGPTTPEESRKMWLKAAEGMDPEVRKAGGDFLFKIQNKLTDWIALHLKEATDPFGEFKANMRDLGHALGPMFLGKGAGGLLGAAGAMAGGFMKAEGPAFEKMRQDRALELLGLKKTTQPSQMFAEPEEFARQAITGVLTSDPQKEQVKLLEEARDQIKEFKDKVVEALPKFGRWAGIFPRG